MKKYLVLILAVFCIGLIVLMGCIDFTGDPREYTGDNNDNNNNNNEQDNEQVIIQDGDVVQLYGDYIISGNPNYLNIIHTNQGDLSMFASLETESEGISDLIVWGNYLITAYYYVSESHYTSNEEVGFVDYHTVVSVYDLSTLNNDTTTDAENQEDLMLEDEFLFNSLFTVQLNGKGEYVKIMGNTLYLFSRFGINNDNSHKKDEMFGYYQENGEVVEAKILSMDYALTSNFATLVAVDLEDEFASTAVAWQGYTRDVCFTPMQLSLFCGKKGIFILNLMQLL